jgi:hypothetical protein
VIAKRIFFEYIRRGAHNEVNISFAAREGLTRRFEGKEMVVNGTMFAEAFEEVRVNFLNDGFLRFMFQIEKSRGWGTPGMPSAKLTALSTRV